MTERRIVFVQHGDYAEAAVRFAQGGDETYAAQRYSVDFVARLAETSTVTVLCLPAPHGEQRLENGVTSIGLGWKKRRNHFRLLSLLERLRPTDIVLRTPLPAVLAWGLVRQARVLPIIADSFDKKVRDLWSFRAFIALCKTDKVQIVSNHNRAASQALVDLGVSAEKVVPWDWPQLRQPDDLPPKDARSGGETQIFYAGTLSEDKGLPDLIRAVGHLGARDVRARLVVAGAGDTGLMQDVAREAGVLAQIEFLGRIANTKVFSLMRESDIVVVPSRHSYPEGLPIVITEALCSRTPLLLSDHPVFRETFGLNLGMRYFTAGDAGNLAEHLEEIITDEETYRQLSLAGQGAWQRAQTGVAWGEVVSQWLAGGPADLAALQKHALVARA